MAKSPVRSIFPKAITEYAAGLHASRIIWRLLVPPVALGFALAFLVGLIDMFLGWRLSIPLWMHLICSLSLVIGLAIIAENHIRSTREIGRRFLSQGGDK